MGQTINQVRHFYFAKTLKSALDQVKLAGDIFPKADKTKSTLWFNYMSPGGLVSSDKISIANVLYTKSTPSGSMAHKLDRYEVTLDASVNSGNPIAGEEYILRVAFRQYIGLSEEDQYFKYGMVKVKGTMSKSKFYKELASSLAKNVANETTPLINIYVHSAATTSKGGFDSNGFMQVTQYTVDNGKSDTSNSYYDGSSAIVDDIDKIIIEQVEQDWVLGMMPQAFIPFTIQFLPITDNGDDVLWGTVTKVASTKTVDNGHNIADLEYFCMGARGDMYRGMGYPNFIKTTYLIDPTKKYDTLDIHYAYIGDNESVQKSERTITLVCEDDGSHTAMKALIAAINTASGLTIADPA